MSKKKFIVLAPNGDRVVLNTTNGTYTFKHGEIVEDENLAKIFPNIFIPKFDDYSKSIKEEKVVEKIKDVKEENIEKNVIEESQVEEVSLSENNTSTEVENVIENVVENRKKLKRK